MYVYYYIALTLLIPTLAFIPVMRTQRYLSYYFIVSLLLFLSVCYFMYYFGAWPYIGYNWRPILGAVFLISFIFRIYFRLKKNSTGGKNPRLIFSVIITILLGGMFWLILLSRPEPASSLPPVELQFPFRHGKYAIQQGGDNAIGNAAHRRNIPASLAMDIVKLNANNRRCTRFFSKDVQDYVIYGDTVISPCDATVLIASDGINDNVPPVMNTGNRGGNYIILRKDDVNIILCHLQKSSLMVHQGQRVHTGDPLGIVGNTGYSIEPHLHIQAYKKGIYSGHQVPIHFDGKLLKLNDVYEVN